MRAVSTLEAHHSLASEGIENTVKQFGAAFAEVASIAGATEGEGKGSNEGLSGVGASALSLVAQAKQLEARRGKLLELVLPMRSLLADVLLEEHDLRPSGVALGADVEARSSPPVPAPLPGVDLTAADQLHVLAEVVRWSKKISVSAAFEASGPAYLLSLVIEHPTDEARRLRQLAREVREALLAFAARAVD